MTDVLDELTQAYSFTRDELLGKAIDEIKYCWKRVEK